MILTVFFVGDFLSRVRANQEDKQVGGQGVEAVEEYMPQIQVQ